MRTTPSTLSTRPFLFALAAMAVSTSALAIEGTAHADEPAVSAPSAPSSPSLAFGDSAHLGAEVPVERTIEWYGWQTLSTDAASLALLVGGLAPALGALAGGGGSSNNGLLLAGIAGYSLGAPAIHVAHGHWKTALLDLGMRVGGAALGATTGMLLGMASGGLACDQCFTAPQAVGLMAGTLAGALAASAVDASVFARTKAPVESKRTSNFSWAPSLAPARGGASAGISGTF
jgi:hypothetical protein